LFLDLPLPPTPPFTADHCGACTRCLNACPTQCILPDRTIDARRCISYLTIENKGDIPEDLRPLIGAWAFGCDVCQQVCPWNVRFAAPTDEPHFAPRHAAGQADLAAELGLDAPAFNRKFKGRPQKRAKRRGYLRNLAVAAGNTGGPDIVPALQLAANDDEALVRRHAVWALEQIQRRTGLSGGADEMKDA
jgi:epoxyqueuosine reductase